MVLARVITLRFDPTIGSFDDMPLREFLKDKEALSIREHFFAADDIPYLAVFITYRLSQVKRPVAAAEATPKGDRSWQTMLTDDEKPLFNALRDWRNERSKQDGLPVTLWAISHMRAMNMPPAPSTMPDADSAVGGEHSQNYETARTFIRAHGRL